MLPYVCMHLHAPSSPSLLNWRPTTIRAPATKVRQNLSIVAKNENSTEHFVHLHADCT